jgi:hypothetical protein
MAEEAFIRWKDIAAERERYEGRFYGEMKLKSIDDKKRPTRDDFEAALKADQKRYELLLAEGVAEARYKKLDRLFQAAKIMRNPFNP